ncbi:MAG: hypothetical protein ABR575_07865 [Actinomycetota bacterium]
MVTYRRVRRAALCALAALCVLAGSIPAVAAPTTTERARAAASYLARRQHDGGAVPGFSKIGSTADAVLSWVAVERGAEQVRDAIRYLKLHHFDATTVGLKAKLVLALVAAGKDPRAFAGHDFVAEIAATRQSNGRYGATTPVIEHALAILALSAAGEIVPSDPSGWLVAAQCPDGGWQYDAPYSSENDDEHCKDRRPGTEDFFTSDTNTTSYAVQALTVEPTAAAPSFDAFSFFATARDRAYKKGWVYDPLLKCTAETPPGPDSFCYVSDANSTSLVLEAYAAAGRDVPTGGRKALGALQYRLCGRRAGAVAFTWEDADGDGVLTRTPPDAGASIDAVRGFLLRPLPIAPTDVDGRLPRRKPC